MKALLDTNIIIHRETSNIMNENIGLLFNWIDKTKYKKYIHPITISELERHVDKNTVSTIKVKLQSYNVLKTTAPLHENVKNVSDRIDKDQNDINDTILLNEVYQSRVDCLITEDKKIHRKADELSIGHKVYRISEFIEKAMADNPEFVDYKTLSVKKEYFGNIDVEDPFFNSFRKDYKGFDDWFNRKAEEISYICNFEENITAFLYLKKEGVKEVYTDIKPPLPPKKRLKIGTFKVVANGFKIGERFLKIVFDNAFKLKVDEIYVTVFDHTEEQKRLIDLLEYWGFKYWGTKETPTGIENVYTRPFVKNANKENPRETFPFLSKKGRVFLVPIYPDYHTELFPDSILQTESTMDFIENLPHRNAIKKVYVSHSHERNLSSGDIIVFYRTGGYFKSVVTTIGIVESKVEPNSIEELESICRKRTVLTKKELYSFWNRYSKNKPFVVNFLYAFSFPNPFKLNLKRLIEIGVIKNSNDAPRGFKEIGWDAFVKLYKEANI